MKMIGFFLILAFATGFITSCGVGYSESDEERKALVPNPSRRIRLVSDEANTPLLNEKDFFSMAGEIYGYAGRCVDEGLITPKAAAELRNMCESYNQCVKKYIEVYGHFVSGAVEEIDAEKLLSYSIIVGEEKSNE